MNKFLISHILFFICYFTNAPTNILLNGKKFTIALIYNEGLKVDLTNTTPAQSYNCTTTNTSAVVGMTQAQAATLSC